MRPLAPERAVASFDSASAILRAISNALHGKSFPHLGRGPVRALPTRYSMLLPVETRRRAYGIFGGFEGVQEKRLGALDMEHVAEWIVSHYDAATYPGVVIGSPNGAVAHLCAETGMPFLPQTLLVPVHRDDNDADDAQDAMRFGERVAGPLLENNPDVVLHHMHDGNQDRLMVEHMAYFRLKWRAMPAAYRRFLDERLDDGAPVVFLADDSTWPTTRVGERHVFQTGARGGLTAEEYVHGSPRVAEFLREEGSPRTRFVAPEPDGVSAEAEWGYDARIADELTADATYSHPVVTVHVTEPEALSAATARLLRERARGAGADGDRLIVESFVMLDPVEVRRTGSVPYWSFFPVEDSLERCGVFVEEAARAGDPYGDVDILLFPHGVESVGATPPRAWHDRLRDHVTGGIRFVSGTQERWPAHFDALGNYGPGLRQLPAQPEPASRLSVDDMLRAVDGGGVRVESWPVLTG